MNERKRVIALGFFDGVHVGHSALLRTVARVAQELGAIPAAVTFDRHPEDVIAGERKVPLLTTPEGRGALMRELFGIEDVIVAHFDRAMMEMPWESFVEDYLVKEHGAVHLVAGHDFHFGYRGAGNPDRLREKCAQLGIGCDIVAAVEREGITVSSSYIRILLAEGDVERATEFLGHPYSLEGEVGHGKRLGTELGFPTVNLSFPAEVMTPAFGVYAARAWVEDRWYAAAVNVGVRPTVEEGGRVNAEGFLLDFSGDLYGKTVRLDFCRYLRPERRFADVEELRAEVMRNADQTRAYFGL